MTINSTYKSPVRLVAYTGEMIRPYSGSSLASAKNKLLQEAEGKFDITIEGVKYNIEEITTLLDNQDEESWHYHSLVYSLKGMLVFLENNSFDDSLMSRARQFRYNPGFVRFVSPFFANSFNNVSRELITSNDFEQLNLLFDHSGFMITADQFSALNSIFKYLEGLNTLLKDLDFEKLIEDESVLDFIFLPVWIHFINKPLLINSEQRNEVVHQIASLLTNFQGKANWPYLKELLRHVQLIDYNDETRSRIDEAARVINGFTYVSEKNNKNELKQQLIWGGGAIAITLLILSVIYFSGGTKKDSYNSVEKEYDKTIKKEYIPPLEETEHSIVKDELKSSTIEQKFKSFLYQIAYQNYRGKLLSPENGINPIEGVTRLPGKIGSAPLTITNNCRLDALIFYFNDKNVLSNKNSRVYAAYIKSGGSFSMTIDPNFGRLNIVFGHDWITLSEPFKFNFSVDQEVKTKSKATNSWIIKKYFAYPSAFTRYIDHDINITNYQQPSDRNSQVPLPKLIFEPEAYGYSKNSEKFVTLEIIERDGNPFLYGKGTFYIYESPLRF